MKRLSLASLLLLGGTAFSGRMAHAQQPTPSSPSGDRPTKTVITDKVYGNYRYRLGSGAQHYFAGFSQMARVSVLNGEPTGRPGAEKLTGRSNYEEITLERGVTHDNTFAQWANQTQEPEQLRNLTLDIYNQTGQLSSSRTLIGCAVNGIQSADNIAIERMQLRCRFDAIVQRVLIRRLPE